MSTEITGGAPLLSLSRSGLPNCRPSGFESRSFFTSSEGALLFARADSTSTRSNSLLSRSVKRQRSSELVAHQPQVSLRDDRPAEQNVRPEIALDGIGAGDNLPTDSVPVQDQG